MKKKKKLKKIWIIILVVLVLLLIYPTYLSCRIIAKDYKASSIYNIVTKGIKDEVIANEYSKTVEVAVNSKDFVKDNLDSYFKINYVDKDSFIDRINKLLKIGYSVDDINLINEKLSDEMVTSLYSHDFISDISSYMAFDFFKSDNLYR